MNDSRGDTDGFLQPVLQSLVVNVWCHGCGTERPINAVYAPYVVDGIQSCRHCRETVRQSEIG